MFCHALSELTSPFASLSFPPKRWVLYRFPPDPRAIAANYIRSRSAIAALPGVPEPLSTTRRRGLRPPRRPSPPLTTIETTAQFPINNNAKTRLFRCIKPTRKTNGNQTKHKRRSTPHLIQTSRGSSIDGRPGTSISGRSVPGPAHGSDASFVDIPRCIHRGSAPFDRGRLEARGRFRRPLSS